MLLPVQKFLADRLSYSFQKYEALSPMFQKFELTFFVLEKIVLFSSKGLNF